MKYQMIVVTPLGTYSGKVSESTEEEIGRTEDLVKLDLNYLYLTDKDGARIIIKKECLANSIITICRIKE